MSSFEVEVGDGAVVPSSPAHKHSDNSSSSNEVESTGTPLDTRILQVIKSCKNYTIRPAKLATELGISVDDACSELCGLLSVVGPGASFQFESIVPTNTNNHNNHNHNNTPPAKQRQQMVFTFPPDFASRAVRTRRKEDTKEIILQFVYVAIKGIKIVTAFGLIFSLFILCIAAVVFLIAAIIALSQNNNGGGHNSRNDLIIHVRTLFLTMRQLLWFYAMFGPDHMGEGEHPFLSELAYDFAMFSTFLFSPFGWYYMMRVRRTNRRRRYTARGWGVGNRNDHNTNTNEEGNDTSALLAGNPNTTTTTTNNNNGEYRGLLSVAVEFLFGPSPFDPGPTEVQKWKLRGLALLYLSATATQTTNKSSSKKGNKEEKADSQSNSEENSLALEQISPYMDYPPVSLHETATIVSGCLPIVAHFNGIPISTPSSSSSSSTPSKARFFFPELLSESDIGSMYEDVLTTMMSEEDPNNHWNSFLFIPEEESVFGGEVTNSTTHNHEQMVPLYVTEKLYKLTKLKQLQFFQCVLLGSLNFFGVMWFRSSLAPDGLLSLSIHPTSNQTIGAGNIRGTNTMRARNIRRPSTPTPIPPALIYFVDVVIKKWLVPILWFYAILFFVLPLLRCVFFILLNTIRTKRNKRRATFAAVLRK